MKNLSTPKVVLEIAYYSCSALQSNTIAIVLFSCSNCIDFQINVAVKHPVGLETVAGIWLNDFDWLDLSRLWNRVWTCRFSQTLKRPPGMLQSGDL